MLELLTILFWGFTNEVVHAYWFLKGAWCACTHQKKFKRQLMQSFLDEDFSVTLDAGAPLPVISQTLGHQNVNTTAIYLKIDLDGLRRCALDIIEWEVQA